MSSTVRVAVELPPSLFESIERERQRSQESRSGFLRRAITDFLNRQAVRVDMEHDVAAYRKHPETENEAVAVFAMSQEALAGEPFESFST